MALTLVKLLPFTPGVNFPQYFPQQNSEKRNFGLKLDSMKALSDFCTTEAHTSLTKRKKNPVDFLTMETGHGICLRSSITENNPFCLTSLWKDRSLLFLKSIPLQMQ